MQCGQVDSGACQKKTNVRRGQDKKGRIWPTSGVPHDGLNGRQLGVLEKKKKPKTKKKKDTHQRQNESKDLSSKGERPDRQRATKVGKVRILGEGPHRGWGVKRKMLSWKASELLTSVSC